MGVALNFWGNTGKLKLIVIKVGFILVLEYLKSFAISSQTHTIFKIPIIYCCR